MSIWKSATVISKVVGAQHMMAATVGWLTALLWKKTPETAKMLEIIIEKVNTMSDYAV